MATPVGRTFRFSDEELALMDSLAAHLGLPYRADVIRHAIRRLANQEFGPGQTGPPTTPLPDQPAGKPGRPRKE